MKWSCNDFRARLELALASRAEARELEHLGWHEHLLGCADCRALLQSEEALELLLASLPDPELPPELAQRILARLRRAREAEVARAGDPLDQLLALDSPGESPPDLARRVLARLDPERARLRSQDERLDRLLDLALGEIDVPVGLSARVLARLAPQTRELAGARRGWRRALLPLAAAVLVIFGAAIALWRALQAGRATIGRSGAPVVQSGSETPRTTDGAGDPAAPVSDELLASLDLLESWDALEAAGVSARDDLSDLDGSDLLALELLAEAELELGLETRRDERR